MSNNNYQHNRNQNQGGKRQSPSAPLHPPLEVPEAYIEAAEKVMQSLLYFDDRSKKYKMRITSSKIRSFYALTTDIYTIESTSKDDTLRPDSINKLNMMRVRILYDAGRYETEVKPFVEKSNIISYIKGIGTSREKFIKFAKYLEALVAYHRFLGGSEL